MSIIKITIGRLFNLGNYEHVRYDVTAELMEGQSATEAMIGLERIIEALKPDRTTKTRQELDREAHRIAGMALMNDQEWERQHGSYGSKTRAEQMEYARKSLEQEKAKADAAHVKAKKARELLDDLGGASQWKDAKLAWEDDFTDIDN